MQMKGKRAIVTGASRGIGAAISCALAEHGVDLVLTGRDGDALAQVARKASANGVNVGTVRADLTDPAAPGSIVAEAVGILGGLDYLINNAGVAGSKPFADTSLEDWETHIAVNARAPFFLCQRALPYLAESTSPSIINIASVVATKGYENQSAYSASKHALLGFTKAMAKELQSLGIRVHTVSPGGVATELVTAVRPDIDPSDLIQPEDVADIVIFLLASGRSGMIDEISVRRSGKTPWL
jgi:3-oxoacyl-[acyl-carrier protein] reductase